MLQYLLIFTSAGFVFFLIKYLTTRLKSRKIEYEFTSIANHAFRTPLTRINWISKELEKELTREERLLNLQNLENATSKLLEIVDLIVGLRNVNSTAGYFFEATSLRDIVEKSLKKYREEISKKNIVFQVATFENIPLFTADIKKISFVIDTLIENAIFYTPTSGKISIECSIQNKKLIILVKDTGLGLDQKDRQKIFTRFYRGKRAKLAYPDGMGLRLYLTKDIVERHHGKIYAESNGISKGTNFILKLPLEK